MMGFNDPEVVGRARAGELGPAMKSLLADGIPEGWTLFDETMYYQCPGCGYAIEGATVRVDDGSGNWLVFHHAPPACGKCGSELVFRDDKVPMSWTELMARCEDRGEGCCPNCWSKDVEAEFGSWD